MTSNSEELCCKHEVNTWEFCCDCAEVELKEWRTGKRRVFWRVKWPHSTDGFRWQDFVDEARARCGVGHRGERLYRVTVRPKRKEPVEPAAKGPAVTHAQLIGSNETRCAVPIESATRLVHWRDLVTCAHCLDTMRHMLPRDRVQRAQSRTEVHAWYAKTPEFKP
jgi:hypothetical protein